MNVDTEKLKKIISDKIHAAGMKREDADIMSDVIVFADRRGIRSHGTVRVEYYCERIAKGGVTLNPKTKFDQTGPCSAVLHGDNGPGMVLCKTAMEQAIKMARDNGVAIVGVREMSHSGAISYYTQMAAEAGMVSFACCLADPMVVPYGGADPFYGTNPMSFSVPTGDKAINFDMATSVQAWGKIWNMRARNEPIPDSWAIDGEGHATTDPHKVRGLLPASGPKGYGLMMMVDVLSGILMGLPFGKSVSSMYSDLSKGRNLGQMHIVINPKFFGDEKLFIENIKLLIQQLHDVRPAHGFEQVLYPGEIADIEQQRTDREGIDVIDHIYDYLVSDKIHHDTYDHKNPFAES